MADAMTEAMDAAWDEFSSPEPCDVCGQPATTGKYGDRFCGEDENNCAGFVDSCNPGGNEAWWECDPGALSIGYTPSGGK